MKVEQYVMAYLVEHDRLRSVMPAGFTSIRPVLRINAEIRDGSTGYVEFNTAVERDGVKGWLNISFWDEVPFKKEGKKTEFNTDFLDIAFVGVGIEGSCPAEKDNAGCFFLHGAEPFRKASTRYCRSTLTLALMTEVAQAGKAVVMVSSELPELIGMCTGKRQSGGKTDTKWLHPGHFGDNAQGVRVIFSCVLREYLL